MRNERNDQSWWADGVYMSHWKEAPCQGVLASSRADYRIEVSAASFLIDSLDGPCRDAIRRSDPSYDTLLCAGCRLASVLYNTNLRGGRRSWTWQGCRLDRDAGDPSVLSFRGLNRHIGVHELAHLAVGLVWRDSGGRIADDGYHSAGRDLPQWTTSLLQTQLRPLAQGAA
jgi:hypothetical protein